MNTVSIAYTEHAFFFILCLDLDSDNPEYTLSTTIQCSHRHQCALISDVRLCAGHTITHQPR
ncbi:uncharacterized protein PHALS_15298 [Plasmopara halstedii]|uniref:Uncharacterized protein n=1 Tax=Plasmopara halstedii TaxID=4781 RepID=A0A0P1ABN6_PLAHL|nr:uncharacterized protein PHALS_15298 [Plasmopara halstedii]CEG38262.1 hypothetical protein PHALS_15298 [Plasmopara halstedii]|eukprot:XP_024574631.1 hypothetical protein PHALS_15298 [Plasmopara halstedii]